MFVFFLLRPQSTRLQSAPHFSALQRVL